MHHIICIVRLPLDEGCQKEVMNTPNYSAIKQIFTDAVTLKSYLEHIFGRDYPIELPHDKAAYKSLLNDTMVVIDLSTKDPLTSNNKVVDGGCSISDVINRLIAHLLRNNTSKGEREQNCLTFGYRAKGKDANVVMGSDMNTECKSIQTGITIITSASWQTLLKRIGESQLRELLTHPVFLKTVNGSYLQVSGTLASELARKQLKLRQEKKRHRTAADDEDAEEAIAFKRCPSTVSATSEISSSLRVNTNTQSTTTSPSPLVLSGKSTLMRFKLLYNHRSCPIPGLPSNHSFLKKSPSELLVEIFPVDMQQWLSTGHETISTNFVDILCLCKENYKGYDAVRSMRKLCPGRYSLMNNNMKNEKDSSNSDIRLRKVSALKGIEKYAGKHFHFNTDSDSSSEDDNFSEKPPKTKKRRMRGSRGGRSVKQRRRKQESVEQTLNDPVPFSFTPTSSYAPRETTTVGNRLIEIILGNVARDISVNALNDEEGFHTQEGTQQEVSPSSIIQNTGDSIETKSKSQRIRIKRKLKKLLSKECKSPTRINLSSAKQLRSSIYDPPSILHPTPSSDAQIDCGRVHHVNRHYPLSPLATHATSPMPKAPSISGSALDADLEDAVAVSSSGKSSAPVRTTEIWEFSTPVNQVSEFIKSLVRATFPYEKIWGSKRNEDHMMRHIDTYISLGRTESMCLSQVTHSIHLGVIPWLSFVQQSHSTRQSFFFCFVYWFFNHFITPCIATTFYVTEVEGKLSELFFFKKKLWLNLIRNHLPQFHKQFVPIHLDEKYFDVASLAPSSTTATCGSSGASNQGNNNGSSLQLTRAVTFPLPTVTMTTFPSQQLKSQGGRQSLLFNNTINSDEASQKRQTLEDWSLSVLLGNTDIQSAISGIQSAISGTPTASAVSQSLKRLQQYMDHLPTVRFVPKKATLRPITNLKAKAAAFMKASASMRRMPMSNAGLGTSTTEANNASATSFSAFNRTYSNASNTSTNNATGSPVFGEVVTNKMLYNSLYTLQQIYTLHEEELSGFGVFGFDEIYRKLRLFKEIVATQQRLEQQQQRIQAGSIPFTATISGDRRNDQSFSNIGTDPSPPRFYIAALDLEKCYDNIDTSALYDLVKAILIGKATRISPQGSSKIQPSSSSLPPLHTANTSYHQHPVLSTTSSLFHNGLPRNGYMSINRDCVIHKYYVTHLMTSMERVYSKILRYVAFDEEVMTFKHAGTEIAKNFCNSIISDNVSYSRTNASDILKLLKAHLFQHVVKLPIGAAASASASAQQQVRDNLNQGGPTSLSSSSGKELMDAGNGRCCTQIKGIPQGSVLSSLLCNVYYGYLENLLFSEKSNQQDGNADGMVMDVEDDSGNKLTKDASETDSNDPLGLLKHTMVIRLVDDYLIVSTKQSCVEHFLNTVMTTYPHYGGFVNPAKTKTNFKANITRHNGEKTIIEPTATHQLNGNTYIPWCGYLINIDTLEVCPDASRILNRPLTHSISIDSQQMGNNLKRMIKAFFRMKCHAILIDSSINDRTTVIKNLYELYLLAALRTITHIKKLKYIFRVSIRTEHLIESVYEGIIFASKLLRIRTNRKISRRLELHNSYDGGIDGAVDLDINTQSTTNRGKLQLQSGQHLVDDIFLKFSHHTANRIMLMKEAEKKIKYFGSCPLKATQAIYLGMTSFNRALSEFPITFDNHHQLQTWIRSCLSRSLKSSNHDFSDLMSFDDYAHVEEKVLKSAKEFN